MLESSDFTILKRQRFREIKVDTGSLLKIVKDSMPASWMSERLLAMAFAKAIMQDVIVGARFVYKVETCVFVVPWTYFSYGYVCSGTCAAMTCSALIGLFNQYH